jgi:hypothetical protein
MLKANVTPTKKVRGLWVKPLLRLSGNINRQFMQELAFYKGKLILAIVDALQAKDGEISVSVDDLRRDLMNASVMIDGILDTERLRLGWGFCIDQMLDNLRGIIEEETLFDGYLQSVERRNQAEIDIELALKLKSSFFAINQLRSTKMAMRTEQHREEWRIYKEIRKEFDGLVTELSDMIEAEKFSFIRISEQRRKLLSDAITRMLDDPATFDKFTDMASAFRSSYEMAIQESSNAQVHSPDEPLPESSSTNIRFQARLDTVNLGQDLLEKTQQIFREFSVRFSNAQGGEEEEETVCVERMIVHSGANELAGGKQENEEIDEYCLIQRSQRDKMANVENDILCDKRRIATMRITRFVERMATSKVDSRRIAKAEEEKRNRSAALWIAQRTFESDQNQRQEDIQKMCTRLADLEIEVESLRNRAKTERGQLIQLRHAKEMCLAKVEGMRQKEADMTKGWDTGTVEQLLGDLSLRKKELKVLEDETGALERAIECHVREPMREIDRINVRTRRISAERCDVEKTVVKAKESKFEKSVRMRNEELRAENEELKRRVEDMELAKKDLTPTQMEIMKTIFDGLPKEVKSPKRNPATARSTRRVVKPGCDGTRTIRQSGKGNQRSLVNAQTSRR